MARSSLRFADAQEQATALCGWNQDYLQLSAGAFAGELAQVSGHGIKLFVERVQQSVLQTGQLPAREHTMLGLELQLPDHVELPLQAGALTHTVRPQAKIKAYVMELYQSARRDPALLSNPAVVASVSDFLLDSLLRAPNLPGTLSGTANTHWALVQRCVALVNASQDSAPTVTQLCQEMGVSRRTLQNAFLRVLDMSPLAYVKAVRLKQAREALKRSRSVTEAATACGFWHFGHFAHDYLTLFGERPSDTLRRQN